MRIGFHVSISGSLAEAVERAKRLHCQTMQIFSRNPRGWQLSKVKLEEIKEFKKRRKTAQIYPLFVHVPYLINLASPDKKIWTKSVNFFSEDLRFSELIGADYLVTHLGSHRGAGEEFGIMRFCEGINFAMEKAKSQIKILLENTAGQGNSLGYNFSQIGQLRRKIIDKEKIGLCLDTAHAFSAGYKINTKEGLDKLLMELADLELIENLELIHLNDSKTEAASRIDRHQHIGKGKIAEEGFRLILNHPKLRNLNFIMETPKKSEKDDLRNLRTVQSLLAPHF